MEKVGKEMIRYRRNKGGREGKEWLEKEKRK